MINIKCKREGSYRVEVTKVKLRKKIDKVVDDIIKYTCPYSNRFELKSVEIIITGKRV